MATFDYIIVGAGSAGCVLASRLSENPALRILLLEAGGNNNSPYVRMPRAWVRLRAKPEHAWTFPVEDDGTGPRNESWLRGRGLGGSSAINGMVYSRGFPGDYAAWEGQGGTGWGWSEMARCFRAIENHEQGANDERGTTGPLQVGVKCAPQPLFEAAIAAGGQMGLPRVDDLNGASREGIGYITHSVDRRGRRSSAKAAFLDPARGRPNLTVMTNTRVAKILFEGRRAVGVLAGGHEYRATRDIVLSAGALHTPQLLQVSGIGPGELLHPLGIDVVRDCADVGRNLIEHLVFAMPHRLRGAHGHNREFRGLRLLANIARYYATGRGLLSYGASEVGGFVRSAPDVAEPDIQLGMSPYSFDLSRGNWIAKRVQPERLPGFTFIATLIRPQSRGTLAIRTGDMADMPRIRANWLSAEADRAVVVAMVRFLRALVRRPALAPYVAEEISPGATVSSNEDIVAAARRSLASGLHTTGTCRMGGDAGAVVDERLRVRGIGCLRIADCSVIPVPISGNTNAAAMAVGWRAADLILDDAAG